MADKATSLTAEEFYRRLWPRVQQGGPDDCWPWTGGRMGNKSGTQGGYGMIGAGSRIDGSRSQLYVHRECYRHLVGPIPEGLFVLHSCDNRICCNAQAHHFLGTHLDNMRDMFSKGRHTIGVNNPRAILDDDDIREIRRLHDEGWANKSIARFKRVSRPTISLVVNRKIWSHVT